MAKAIATVAEAAVKASLSVIGLGRLGGPLAAILADAGANIVGVDRDEALVTRLQAGNYPALEPGLAALFAGAVGQLSFTTDYAAAIAASTASFILVPTPSTADGGYDHAQLLDAVRAVGRALAGKDGRHLVVIVSTVMPGAMDNIVAPALGAASARALGPQLGLCYCPEFVALGTVIDDMRRPDLVLIGQSDAASGNELINLLRPIWHHEPMVSQMNFINAELTKIAINGFVTTRISYANMLAEISEQLSGADAAVVTTAMGHDSRIGPAYLKPGAAFAGPCFPRDNRAIAALARGLGQSADLATATDAINERQLDRIVRMVQTQMGAGIVGILGLSYKVGTDVCEASLGTALARRLAKLGYAVRVHDPAANTALPRTVERCDSADACARDSDLLVITTPWPDYGALSADALQRPAGKLCIIDCWRMPDLRTHADIVRLIYPGAYSEG